MPLPTRVHDAAARALSAGDSLRALGLIGTLDDPPALLLRGIAYAQIGDLDLARATLSRIEGADELTIARASAAMAEIDLALGKARAALRSARLSEASLERLGDRHNAAMQRLVASRALVLLGDLGGAERAISGVPVELAPVAALALAEIAMRKLEARKASIALAEAARSGHALLTRAVAAMEADLAKPIARLRDLASVREVTLADVEVASSGDSFLIDVCRRLVRAGRATIPLARRPLLFELLVALAERFPETDGIARDELIFQLFGARRPNNSHRIRLRVEVGRLRKILHGIASPDATPLGYALRSARPVLILLPLSDDESARVLTLLGDGAAWSSQELADHSCVSKRTVLRALASLVDEGAVLRTGRGKEIRYTSSAGRIASRMLLLGLVPAS